MSQETKFEKHIRKMIRNGVTTKEFAVRTYEMIMSDVAQGQITLEKAGSDYIHAMEIVNRIAAEEGKTTVKIGVM